jgi:hypothetical protein
MRELKATQIPAITYNRESALEKTFTVKKLLLLSNSPAPKRKNTAK